MQLLKAEIIQNGYGNQYFPEDKLDWDIVSRVIILEKRLAGESTKIQIENVELLAILLFTHEKQDLYVNLKTTMTGKGSKKKEPRANVQSQTLMCPSNNYAKWKDEYQ